MGMPRPHEVLHHPVHRDKVLGASMEPPTYAGLRNMLLTAWHGTAVKQQRNHEQGPQDSSA